MPTVFTSTYSSLTTAYFIKVITNLSLMEKLSTTKNIYIKPNLVSHVHDDKSGVITADKVLIKVLKAIREINKIAFIYILESDGQYNNPASKKFANRNYSQLIKPYEPIVLVDLTRSEQASIPCNGVFFKNDIKLPVLFTNDYFFISLSKIKTHSLTTMSGALKNQFGCLPERDKSVYHPYLKKILADINKVIHPDLCIAEGCPALEGDGPINGIIKDIDTIIMGNNPVLVDTITAKVMGFKPKAIAHIRYSYKKNIGPMLENEITVIGELPTLKRFKQISLKKKLLVSIGIHIQRKGHFIVKVGKVIQYQSLLSSISKRIKRRRNETK